MYSFSILPLSLRLSLIDDDINMEMNENREFVCVGIIINTCHILKWPQLVLQQDEWVTMAGIYASIIVHVWLMFLAMYLRHISVIYIYRWLIALLLTLLTQLYVILLTFGKLFHDPIILLRGEVRSAGRTKFNNASVVIEETLQSQRSGRYHVYVC